MSEAFLDGRVILHAGDCLDVLRSMDSDSIDSCVTDPPYALVSIGKRFGGENARLPNNGDANANVYNRTARGFMGKTWDTGETAFAVELWTEVLRVLKPGGHIAAFGGTRTFHRLACAIEDAGFEIRDQIQWIFGSGFPKSHSMRNIGRPELGTALKPANEPICLARKPLSEKTVAANVLRWGTGAINVDGCRIEGAFVSGWSKSGSKESENGSMSGKNYARDPKPDSALGRWPSNLCHDGSQEVLALFPAGRSAGNYPSESVGTGNGTTYWPIKPQGRLYADSGSAARFFASFPCPELALEEVELEWISDSGKRQALLLVATEQSLARVIAVSALGDVNGWNTFLFGSGLMDLFRTEWRSTIATKTSSTTSFPTWNWLIALLTSVCTEAASFGTEHGGNRVESVENSSRSIAITLGKTVFLPGANHALSETQLRISVKEGCPGQWDRKRIFYSSKADADNRIGSRHPTIKPIALMQWLCRLVTPSGGAVLDPFAGTGTTGEAAWREGCSAIIIEREAEYQADIARRMKYALGGPDERRHTIIKAKGKTERAGPLFDFPDKELVA